MRMLFFAHSGLRYLVLLVGILALVAFIHSVSTGKGDEKRNKALGAAFTGLLDLQILIGIGMVVLGLYYSALIGHMFMMIAAAVVSHVAMSMAKSAEPIDKRDKMRLIGVGMALLLVVAGIMSIGRAVFGSGAPTIIS